MVTDLEWLRKRGVDSLRHRDRFFRALDVRDEHGELVASETGDGVSGSDGSTKTVGDFHQKSIAGLMAVSVVDEFESIEIEEENGKG